MLDALQRATMLSMNASASRIVLLPESRAAAREGKIRRYRLARVKLDEAAARTECDEPRFAHLKRLYD